MLFLQDVQWYPVLSESLFSWFATIKSRLQRLSWFRVHDMIPPAKLIDFWVVCTTATVNVTKKVDAEPEFVAEACEQLRSSSAALLSMITQWVYHAIRRREELDPLVTYKALLQKNIRHDPRLRHALCRSEPIDLFDRDYLVERADSPEARIWRAPRQLASFPSSPVDRRWNYGSA